MIETLKQQESNFDAKPKKFVLWLFVVSSTIMFGGWTSYYIVFAASKGKGHGLVLPDAFMYSTAVLLLSSVFLFLSTRALRTGNKRSQQVFLWLTFVLGLLFAYLQFQAWTGLYLSGAVLINNNAAISLIYIVSGFHLLHIFAGLCFVVNALVGSYKHISADKMLYRQQTSCQ